MLIFSRSRMSTTTLDIPQRRLGVVHTGYQASRLEIPLRAGTRGSPLALAQARAVMSLLGQRLPGSALSTNIIRTTGDAIQGRRLADIGGKGLFSKEIHEALLDGRIDLAVHSLKDLETDLPPNIVLACTLPRQDARDALILAPGTQLTGIHTQRCRWARSWVHHLYDGRHNSLPHVRIFASRRYGEISKPASPSWIITHSLRLSWQSPACDG
jgi:hypothetical protein